MRPALRPNPGRRQVSRSVSLPAPVEGWDTLSPLAAMGALRAVEIENWFPQPGYLELRRGHVVHANTGTGTTVDAVMGYHGDTVAQSRLFAASGSKIFDVSGGTSTEVVSGLSSARWQHINFATPGGKFLWICNGVDQERYWDGSAWNLAALTNIAAGDVVQAAAFKGRLWFVLKNSLTAGYLPVDTIQGTVSKFPLGGLLNKGGALQAIGTWALDGGDGPDDYLVFVTNRGQVAVYTGSNPGSGGDFALRGTYEVGAPLGRRGLVRTAGDLALLCQDGVVPLSKALITDRAAITTVALTSRIQPTVADAARQFGDRFGWQILAYPRGTAAIINVPRVEGQYQEQYVMNTVTGAWTKFSGWNANCFEVWKDRLFFGGNDGRVCEADRSGADRGAPIRSWYKQAWNYFGKKGELKSFRLMRAILSTDGTIRPEIGMATDYSTDVLTSPSAVFIPPSPKWDSALWDGAQWPLDSTVSTAWGTLNATGYCGSVTLKTSVAPPGATETETQPPLLRVNAVDVVYETGGLL